MSASPTVPPQPYDERYLAGILFFNRCDFFEAHEVWEELWADTQGPDRPFYQGLIQVAVCLHHFGNGNTRGARKLYHGSRSYLEPFCPFHQGIDLDQLLAQFAVCCAEIVASRDDYPDIPIEPDTIPEIWPSPPPETWPEIPPRDDL